MTTFFHVMARNDTPEKVNVPDGFGGLAVWAIGRFGIGVVFLGMLYFVYQDQKAIVDRMMHALEQRAVVDADIAKALSANASAISTLSNEVKMAHERAKTQFTK